ncbi:ComF family protein [Serinibacter arcticus]|uniref:Phosphoribosyltransferase domain-containing protein n=1 Tax=Serinibacter arcticus TaxID=1655435 RepID=A0A4Z1DWP3_9MICO|nr:phosphoribosyltransferase family protein [Serinibacter arcticus]TGO04055.1 hypothetical protein SERN_2646 [Serinibacter arcticus]
MPTTRARPRPPDGLRVATAAAGALAAEVARLLVPLACAGCDAWDVTLCRRCRSALGPPRRLDGAAPALPDGLPVWGLGVYREELRRTVLAWKLGGRRDLDPVLSAALAGVVDAWLDAGGWSGTTSVGRAPVEEVWVVPAPSRVGRALRGRPSVTGLADAVARRLAERGTPSRVVTALASRGRSTHHVGGGSGRATGPGPGRGRHARVVPLLEMAVRGIVLVDDVLTTGETLARCRSAVARAGGEVLGAVVLAAAGSPGGPSRMPSRPRVD